MGWYKFKKKFKSGQNTYIKLIPEDELKNDIEKILNEYCREIGENTPGGHACGYNVECDECVPTIEEINKLIKGTEAEIKYNESTIWNLKNKLLQYHRELEKFMEKENKK